MKRSVSKKGLNKMRRLISFIVGLSLVASLVLVLSAGNADTATVVPGLNFPGVGAGDYGFTPNTAPPDANGAVGATQYVQWVNTSLAIFDKNTGALIFGPTPAKTVWQGFGGFCEATDDGHLIVLSDKLASRWVIAKPAVTGWPPFLECVAVSQTADATGACFG